MDDDLARFMTMVDHGADVAEAQRWFTLLDETLQNGDEPPEDWRAFGVRLREAGTSFDASTVDGFIDGADAGFSDPLALVHRFAAEIGAEGSARSYSEARTTLGLDAPGDGTAPAEPDWARFAVFLDRNDHQWQQTWPESREWLLHTARQSEGFGPEADSFESHADQGHDLDQLLEVHGAGTTTEGVAQQEDRAAGTEPPTPDEFSDEQLEAQNQQILAELDRALVELETISNI